MLNPINVYDNYSSVECYELAVEGVNCSELLYYLLRKRLKGVLCRVYQAHGFGLSDDFDDTLDDFFLYLYDWNAIGSQKPFVILESVRDKSAFFGWIVGAYRNFLLNKAREEGKRSQLMREAFRSFYGEEWHDRDETMVLFLATAIAYADQHSSPRNRFVCYRMLLSLLDHTRAIPQEMMATALDMLPVTYRVCSKRQKDRLGDFILVQEAGHHLELDSTHVSMRDQMVERFHLLYGFLMECYEQVLEQLPSADKIRTLRKECARAYGMTMHEDILYGFGEDQLVRHLFDFLNKVP